ILAWQSGQPLNVQLANPRMADGGQRPNVTGNPRSSFSIKQVVDGKGRFANANACSDPGDQVPGNAPRYDSRLRGDGINNLDASIFKNFKVRESMNVQFRGNSSTSPTPPASIIRTSLSGVLVRHDFRPI